jgi:hypothetical protein
MYPHRLIYQSNKSKVPGEVKLSPGLVVRLLYHTVRGFGAGLIAFAVVGVIFSFGPIVKSEVAYKFADKETAEVSKFAEVVQRSQAAELGLDPYFSIFIPKIDAKAKVIANVNAASPKDYLAALQEGVAHAAGTNFPGQGKTVYFPTQPILLTLPDIMQSFSKKA